MSSKVTLDSVSYIFNGKYIKKEWLQQDTSKEKEKEYVMLNIKDVNSMDKTFFMSDETVGVKIYDRGKEHMFEKYVLQDNDILITCRGTTFKYNVFKIKNGMRFIPTTNLGVIRVKDPNILPEFIVAYFYTHKEIFEEFVKPYNKLYHKKGTETTRTYNFMVKTINFNIFNIKELEIPSLSLEEQKKYVKEVMG